MDPTTIGALGGAALGLLNTSQQQENLNKQRQYQAMVARFSPWTHQQAQPVGNANPIGNVLSGALTGVALGQGVNALGGSGGGSVTEIDPNNSTSVGDSSAPNFNGPSLDRTISTDSLGNEYGFNAETGQIVPLAGSPKNPSWMQQKLTTSN